MAIKALKGILLATGICMGWTGIANAQGVGFVSLFADVGPTGGVLSSSGLNRAISKGNGVYILVFTRDVADCSIATSPVGGGPVRHVSLVKLANPKKIKVFTRAGTNGTDMRFMASVTCSP